MKNKIWTNQNALLFQFYKNTQRARNDAAFKIFTEEQLAMAEAADAEAMRKKFIQMQEEMTRLRRIVQKQKKKVR